METLLFLLFIIALTVAALCCVQLWYVTGIKRIREEYYVKQINSFLEYVQGSVSIIKESSEKERAENTSQLCDRVLDYVPTVASKIILADD